MGDHIVTIYILAILFVVFLPTLVAIRNGGNWFVIFIANFFAPLTPVTWIALLFLALRKRH